MRYLPVRLHTTRNYHSSVNNLTTALWSDINTRLNNLSTTTNFILDIIFFFIKLVNSLFHVNTDIFRINNDLATILTNRFSGKRYVLSATDLRAVSEVNYQQAC